MAFMTANYVARETGWAMRGWGHGDRATSERFRSPQTFAGRFEALLKDVRPLGFETIDLWGVHLHPEWATDPTLDLAGATDVVSGRAAARKLIRDGAIGTVRAVYAEANWGRIESWHPSPQGLYGVGAVVDVGIYPLTILTAMFGPARRVVAYGTILERERITIDHATFLLETPDFNVALVELESGVVVRLTATFWVRAGKTGRPRRAGAFAAHVVEILDAIARSASDGAAVEVGSHFEPPSPLEWAGS
ncbi:MAG: hypothetical protein H0V79_09695 [Actinobacteria bacterium]|nr:hypothetical protein [Actinomycetota bacterium]